eukprot:CAMPEP_0118645028 /NCGR_PEP_ID=MMETSP0785-20121206/7275_1 /TAXON_ID=91992 /ORGANISM="Bolidomonas pacifica, Strain CCMP 1866" /LENGTH=559 /DNA_ID=CAMNT_0006536869 /DNA_START=133 /DNA_END=1809 /DNA_ORIENTATION=-
MAKKAKKEKKEKKENDKPPSRGASSRMKALSTKFAKIDIENDDLEGKTYLIKGERGRKALFGKKAKDDTGGQQNHFIGGARGMIDGMDAYTHLTVLQIKLEEGWWWRLPNRKQRLWWRVETLPEEYNKTVKNKEWMKTASKSEKLSEWLDYYLGKRIKLKYCYHPYKLTFEYLGFTEMETIKLYYIFNKVDRDGSGIIDSLEWLMYLDVERTDFHEKVFAIVDFDGSGEMDYREFCMCCWNYASATPNDLINLAFFLYSTDGVTMKENEIMRMLEHIFGKEKLESNAQARKIKLQLMVMNEEYMGIDLSQFGMYCKKHMLILEPCFEFQRRLRSRCLGGRFWRKQMRRRKKRFEGKTWTDIYEDLRDVAADEIKRAEDYRKKRKLRSLQNRVKMGFFKPPPKEVKKIKVKKIKKPKFMTKLLKQKERYEVLNELYSDVNLNELAERNKSIKEETESLRANGEFGGAPSIEEIEVKIEGIHRQDFMNLLELEQLREETLKKTKAKQSTAKEEQGKEKHQHKVRGLFDYQETKEGDGDAKKEVKRKRELRKTVAGFSITKA